MNKKFVVITITLIVVFLLSISAYTQFIPKSEVTPLDTSGKSTNFDYTSGVSITPVEQREVVYNSITDDYRPKYLGMTDIQYQYFFGDLPKFPQDFFTISRLVYDGKITDYSRLSSAYWLQPEFYPGWFSCINDSYLYNDPAMHTTEGYGCYPAIKEVDAPAGSTAVVNTYFKTGYATEMYQGLIVKASLPDSAKDLKGNELFKQPTNAETYLKCSIDNPDDPIYLQFKDDIPFTNVGKDDWMTILKPTYQEIRDKFGVVTGLKGFQNDWVRILDLRIQIDKNTPKGDYVVALSVDTPCFEINQEYYLSLTHPYYGSLYCPSGHIFRENKPHFQVILHVV